MIDRFIDVWDSDMVKVLERVWATSKFHKPLMAKVAKLIEGNEVLDIGCGLGHLHPHLPADVLYVGLDQSKEMVNRALELHPTAFFLQRDLYNLDVYPFTTVVCLDVLIHQKALDPALTILLDLASKCLIVTLVVSGEETFYKRGVGGEYNLICSRGDVDGALIGFRVEEYPITKEKIIFKIITDGEKK